MSDNYKDDFKKGKFTDIAEKCPNTWEDFVQYSMDKIEWHWRLVEEPETINILDIVGYLIEDYLPSKGIYVDVEHNYHWQGSNTIPCKYKVYQYSDGNFSRIFNTLEEAIYVAFKLIEGREKRSMY